ncbi:hypothetical protein YC2023_004471 [Brassica napus]
MKPNHEDLSSQLSLFKKKMSEAIMEVYHGGSFLFQSIQGVPFLLSKRRYFKKIKEMVKGGTFGGESSSSGHEHQEGLLGDDSTSPVHQKSMTGCKGGSRN